MLAGDRGQHGQRGRQAQLLNSEMPPPGGRGQGREAVNRCIRGQRCPRAGRRGVGGAQPGVGCVSRATRASLGRRPRPEPSSPWLLHREVLLLHEALLQHPLVTQELGPAATEATGPGLCSHRGTRSSEGGRVPPRPYGPAETPGAGWGCVEAKSWIPEAPTAGSCGRWGIWSTRAGCAQGTGEGSMPGWGLRLAPLAEWLHWTEVSSSNRYKEAIRD